MTQQERLDHYRRLIAACEAAQGSPPPWRDDNGYRVFDANGHLVCEPKHAHRFPVEPSCQDAALIAAARTGWPETMAALDELRETAEAVWTRLTNLHLDGADAELNAAAARLHLCLTREAQPPAPR